MPRLLVDSILGGTCCGVKSWGLVGVIGGGRGNGADLVSMDETLRDFRCFGVVYLQ